MRLRIVAALTLGISALLAGATEKAPAASAPAQSALRSQIDEIVAPYVAAADFMGVVAVDRDGEEPLILPYGLASVELGVPHSASDVFMIGSISKQFTAVAILLLEQEGRLKTADLVSEYLPTFGHGGQITLEQLLIHTSGVADIFALERFGETAGQGGSFAEVVADLGRAPLTHPPGTAYAYSNGGYVVLAAIIERVAGVPYGEVLEHRVFAPLEMASTAHDARGPIARRRVPGYDPWGSNGLSRATPMSPPWSKGPGSLWSSAADLLTWARSLHGGRLLREPAYRKLSLDYGHGYGYGVSVFERFGREVIGHDGRIAGYAADLARYLDDRVTIAILSNVQSAARDEIRRLVAAAVFGEEYTVPPPRAFPEGFTAPLDELVGTYSFGPNLEVEIRAVEGRLLARANRGGFSELVPLNQTEWFSRVLYATVRFGRDGGGSVDRLIWGGGDGAPVGRRTAGLRG